MTDKLQKTERQLPSKPMEKLVEKANELLEASLSPATRKAYESRWKAFTTWAAKQQLPSAPRNPDTASTVALFIAHLADAGRKISTIEQHVAAIAAAYKALDLEPPTRTEAIRKLLKGARNTLGTRPDKKKALTLEELAAMVRACEPTVIGRRDRAMLLVGFLGALRRSELVAIHVEHIAAIKGGMRILIPRSKTDQAGEGRTITIPKGKKRDMCPLVALSDWLDASGIASGPVFRRVFNNGRVADGAISDQMVPITIKKYAKAAGLDVKDLSGHSLRSGFVTAAAENGAPDHHIMSQTGHRNVQTLHGYKQANKGLANNPATDFDLE